MIAFYFSNKEKKLRFGDGRKIEVGITHEVEGDLEMCRNGLHASRRLIDALKYAPGPVLWLVDLDEYIEAEDKICSRKRTYIAMCDVEDVLREFSRKQALINIEKIKPYCSDYDYSLINDYLKSGDGGLRSAAESAANYAARSADRSSAESATWFAARSAAISATWSVDNYAAPSAAWSAAQSAAQSSAEYATWFAARSAANSATWSAAWSAADQMLTEACMEKLNSANVTGEGCGTKH